MEKPVRPYADVRDNLVPISAKKGVARTREKIIEATRFVVTRDGAQNVTIRNIAYEAGTSPGLIIQYFGTKSLLLLEIFHEGNRPDSTALQIDFERYSTPLEMVLGTVNAHLIRNLKDPQLTRHVMATSWTWSARDEVFFASNLTRMADQLSVALMERFYPEQDFLTTTATYTVLSAYAGVLRMGLQKEWDFETYMNVLRPSIIMIMQGLAAQVKVINDKTEPS